MAALGTLGETKILYNGTEITIGNNVPLRLEPIILSRRVDDQLDGSVDVDYIGERYEFECQCYIGAEKQFLSVLRNLMRNYNYKKVYCAPFGHEYFKDADGNMVLCKVEMQWGWLKTRNFYDVLNIRFETLGIIDFANLILPDNTRIDPLTLMVEMEGGEIREEAQ